MDGRGGADSEFLDLDRAGRERASERVGQLVRSTPRSARESAGEGVGERLRRLRVAAGLSQSQLAAGRFSKEYVSQIERGKTRPTEETVVWLAERLGVDVELLRTGVAALDRARLETVLVRAEALVVQHRHEEAIVEFAATRDAAATIGASDLTLRALAGEAWSRMELGGVPQAIELLLEARGLAESGRFTDIERADILFRLGVCRYKLSSIQTATALFDEALALAERSGFPCDLLRADILGWPARYSAASLNPSPQPTVTACGAFCKPPINGLK
jgi:transcriptional regulator with XRE-family HTH domain